MNKFTRNSRELLLENKWYSVYLDNVTTPVGTNFSEYYVIECSNESVATLIINEKQEILFVHAFRYILDDVSLEIPCGNVERNETIYDAAKRECEEETGYTVILKKQHYSYYPSNGISNQKIHIFFGVVNKENKKNIFDQEEIKHVEWLGIEKVKKYVNNNEIKDGVTLTALLLFFNKMEVSQIE
ncbi:TPA: NUDIX hydrolase [Enterococcus faecalis]|uniref:NUDIX hydrolase n=1 Tax=Enterococcus faecalis TaxID=1351 RepID=UPI001CB4084D|nr:NUDIX hydrolase [Enterococcus faecalis]HBI3767428.1 NUDIX hydrolase [Enterococcus faecalis]